MAERIHRGAGMLPKMMTERPGDDFEEVGYIHLSLRRNGAMAISGNVGDPHMSQEMLREALDALKRSAPAELVVPASSVAIPAPVFPLR